MLFRPEKGIFKKVQKIEISQIDYTFYPKIEYFLMGIFLEKLSQKRLFFEILDRRECFLSQNSAVLKRKKMEIFESCYSMVFVKESNIFLWVFFVQVNLEKIVF